jgi:hypothetical protein
MFIALLLMTVLFLISCEKPTDSRTFLIPEKAIGTFRIDFTQIPPYDDGALNGTPIEDFLTTFNNWLSDLGIERESIVEFYGFVLPNTDQASDVPFAILFNLLEYDPVVFNNFTVRNPDMQEMRYENHTYWYDEVGTIAVFAKSDREIFVANQLLAMDELLELAYKQPPLNVNEELAGFLRRYQNKAFSIKSKIQNANNDEELPILDDLRDFSCTVDVGLTLKIDLTLGTDNTDLAEGIAALIDGTAEVILGLYKIGLVVTEQMEENETASSATVMDGLSTLYDILNTVNARARDTVVEIEIDPKISTVVELIEYWPAIEGFISSE